MVLSIKSLEADSLARELVQQTGQNITEVVTKALKESLDRLHTAKMVNFDLAAVRSIVKYYRNLPDLDSRTAEQILGYDERGLL